MTQTRLGQALGLSQPAVSRLENAAREPTRPASWRRPPRTWTSRPTSSGCPVSRRSATRPQATGDQRTRRSPAPARRPRSCPGRRSCRRGRGCSPSPSRRSPRTASPAAPGSACPAGYSTATPKPWPPDTGHAKQRALLLLGIAAGHLAAGRVEGAFALAIRALEAGLQYRSGRIVERARAVRRSLALSSPPRVVRDFDERLHGVHL
ncbi:hypothetical protein [Streptomyces sp. NPDC000931]|uniref:helix-turn-helix domain-containing protein n=1 Tax=Streptomyces sp. NPDC000931 TaxID=3154372 RepID=UPI003324CE30